MSATPSTGGLPKSCQNCPSFLTKEETPGFFKKSVGAPMCARFGHVLGKPGLKPAGEAAIAKAFAEGCEAYGEPRPDTAPERPTLQVSVGDPTVIMEGFPDEAERRKVTSCLGCKNFVNDRAVVSDLGWPAGLCAATGRLILSHRASIEARNCDWRSPGEQRDTTAGIVLKPVYEDAFGLSADPVTKFFKDRDKGIVDPTDYPTDREVSEDEVELGIRAWRRIEDPSGSGRYTHLPIFRTDFFEPDEQAKIPRTGDDEAPEHYVDHMGAVYKAAVLMQELDETPALWGPAGTGKTEFARHIAWLMHMPFDRISITETSEVDDLAGSMRARTDGHGGTETYFHYGRVVKRWQKPGVLLLDEPNTGPDAVWQFIRPLTDNSKQLVIDQNESERILRNDSCYFLMAMNPAWDIRNVGARPLADADGNRLAHLMFQLPPEPLERAILEQRCSADGYDLPRETLDAIMKIAADVRRASDDGTLPISWGIRPQIKVARATKWFDLVTCYRLAVTDSLDPEQAQFVLQVVKDHVGSEDGRPSFD